MKIRFSVLLILLLSASFSFAQPDALRGTWSGHWIPSSGGREAVTVRFAVEDGSVVGEMVNPKPVEFDRVSFDSEDLSVVAEGKSPELGRVRIEARIEEETRLNGMIFLGDARGEMRLTKWTFVPRPR